MKVAVFFGGNSCERDISIITALQTMGSMTNHRIMPILMENNSMYTGRAMQNINTYKNIDLSLMDKVCVFEKEIYAIGKGNRMKKLFSPECAMICCHGSYGENGSLQGMLELNDIPYVGSGVLCSAIGMNKIIMKKLFHSMLLNIVPYVKIMRQEIISDMTNAISKVEKLLKYPVIVKPCSQGSSIGIAVAYDRKALLEALMTASYYDSEIIVEKALMEMIELNCAGLRKGEDIIVSAIEQPKSWCDFLTFEEKYFSKSKGGRNFAVDIDTSMQDLIKATTLKICREFGVSGVARVDYMIDKQDNKLYVNEINTIPGSMAYYLYEEIGIEFRELINIMLENALSLHNTQKRIATKFPSRVLDNYNINK